MSIYNLLFYIWDNNITYKPLPKIQIFDQLNKKEMKSNDQINGS